MDRQTNPIQIPMKLLDEQDTKYVSLQETRLKEYNQIPIQLQHYKHLYHISFCAATNGDSGSGILIFVKNTEEILK